MAHSGQSTEGERMFDFKRWCSWAEAQCQQRASANGITAQFDLGLPSPNPGAVVYFKSDRQLMLLEFWETGEADFHGIDLHSKEGFIVWAGRLLNDGSFEETFWECLFAVS
jgi:hypothetical protein